MRLLQLLLLLLLQLLLLPLLFLGQMMPDGAARHRTQNGVMPGHMSGYGAHGSALEATTRRGVR